MTPCYTKDLETTLAKITRPVLDLQIFGVTRGHDRVVTPSTACLGYFDKSGLEFNEVVCKSKSVLPQNFLIIRGMKKSGHDGRGPFHFAIFLSIFFFPSQVLNECGNYRSTLWQDYTGYTHDATKVCYDMTMAAAGALSYRCGNASCECVIRGAPKNSEDSNSFGPPVRPPGVILVGDGLLDIDERAGLVTIAVVTGHHPDWRANTEVMLEIAPMPLGLLPGVGRGRAPGSARGLAGAHQLWKDWEEVELKNGNGPSRLPISRTQAVEIFRQALENEWLSLAFSEDEASRIRFAPAVHTTGFSLDPVRHVIQRCKFHIDLTGNNGALPGRRSNKTSLQPKKFGLTTVSRAENQIGVGGSLRVHYQRCHPGACWNKRMGREPRPVYEDSDDEGAALSREQQDAADRARILATPYKGLEKKKCAPRKALDGSDSAAAADKLHVHFFSSDCNSFAGPEEYGVVPGADTAAAGGAGGSLSATTVSAGAGVAKSTGLRVADVSRVAADTVAVAEITGRVIVNKGGSRSIGSGALSAERLVQELKERCFFAAGADERMEDVVRALPLAEAFDQVAESAALSATVSSNSNSKNSNDKQTTTSSTPTTIRSITLPFDVLLNHVLPFLDLGGLNALRRCSPGFQLICEERLRRLHDWPKLRCFYTLLGGPGGGPGDGGEKQNTNSKNSGFARGTSAGTPLDDLLGIGIEYSPLPRDKIELKTEFDVLSHAAFHKLHVRKTVWNTKFDVWLPIAVDRAHFQRCLPLLMDQLMFWNSGAMEVRLRTHGSGGKAGATRNAGWGREVGSGPVGGSFAVWEKEQTREMGVAQARESKSKTGAGGKNKNAVGVGREAGKAKSTGGKVGGVGGRFALLSLIGDDDEDSSSSDSESESSESDCEPEPPANITPAKCKPPASSSKSKNSERPAHQENAQSQEALDPFERFDSVVESLSALPLDNVSVSGSGTSKRARQRRARAMRKQAAATPSTTAPASPDVATCGEKIQPKEKDGDDDPSAWAPVVKGRAKVNPELHGTGSEIATRRAPTGPAREIVNYDVANGDLSQQHARAVLSTLPRLMNAMLVQIMKGDVQSFSLGTGRGKGEPEPSRTSIRDQERY